MKKPVTVTVDIFLGDDWAAFVGVLNALGERLWRVDQEVTVTRKSGKNETVIMFRDISDWQFFA